MGQLQQSLSHAAPHTMLHSLLSIKQLSFKSAAHHTALVSSVMDCHMHMTTLRTGFPHGLSHQWWEKDSETENRKYWKCSAVEIFLQLCPFKLKLSWAHRPPLLNSFHCSHLVLLYNLDINIKYIHLHMSCFWGRYKSNQALVFWLLLQ